VGRLAVISAVMLSYKRPENVYKIVNQLKKNKLIGEIIVWNNNPDEQLSFLQPTEKVKVIKPNVYVGMNARWLACSQAKYDVVFMQDDDLMVSSDTIRTLYKEWKKDPEIIHGISGRKLNKNFEYVIKRVYGEVEMLVTRAILFDKKYAIDVLKELSCVSKELSSTVKKNGEDIFLSYFVMSRTHRKNKAYNLFDRITELPDSHAILFRHGHLESRTRVARLCKKEFGIGGGIRLRIIMKKSELKNAIKDKIKCNFPALHKAVKNVRKYISHSIVLSMCLLSSFI
jgi:hypothetical protein